MRPIDADALAKFIDYGHLNNPDEKLYSENDIREMIDMMPTIGIEPHWIPRNERLPEENGTYLVYAPEYRGGSSRGKEWHDGIMFANFKAGKWTVENCYWSKPNCVKAWMPLPKPYEVNHE